MRASHRSTTEANGGGVGSYPGRDNALTGSPEVNDGTVVRETGPSVVDGSGSNGDDVGCASGRGVGCIGVGITSCNNNVNSISDSLSEVCSVNEG